MNQEKKDQNNNLRALWICFVIGIPLGIGIYTLSYAEGLSYFSKDPAACANCHIMEPQYDSWQKSSHHAVATCVDCHLPHDFFGKYWAKAENGYHHSKGFTTQDFHEPIMIKSKNKKILQKNCMACHHELVHETIDLTTDVQEPVNCIHCHQSVGHGKPAGLGAPSFKDMLRKEL